MDLDSLEGRYALVRGTMRKVRTLVPADIGRPFLFQRAW